MAGKYEELLSRHNPLGLSPIERTLQERGLTNGGNLMNLLDRGTNKYSSFIKRLDNKFQAKIMRGESAVLSGLAKSMKKLGNVAQKSKNVAQMGATAFPSAMYGTGIGVAAGLVGSAAMADNYSPEATLRNLGTAVVGAGTIGAGLGLLNTSAGRNILKNTVGRLASTAAKSMLPLGVMAGRGTNTAAKMLTGLLGKPKLLGAAAGVIGASALISSNSDAAMADEQDIDPNYQAATQSWHNLRSSTTGLTFGLHQGRHRGR
jgi:hypothetical protein